MKAWLNLLIFVAASTFLFVGSQTVKSAPAVDHTPKRPHNLPNEAIWAGGVDGGSWFVISPRQQRPDVWSVKVYTDVGEPWDKGEFWIKDGAKIKSPFQISFFDGQYIFLVDGAKLVPVGKHLYPVIGHDTVVKVYPQPGPQYSSKPLSEVSAGKEKW